MPDVDVVLVGQREPIEARARRRAAPPPARACACTPASEVVAWTSRRRRRCATRRIRRCASRSTWSRSGEAHACVTAGNTGALMAISRFVLKTLAGIDRPAIATVLPNVQGGYTYVLDLGANVDCTRRAPAAVRRHGRALVAAVEHKERPSVGLLNIGEEDIKGNETVKQAGRAAARERPQLLRQRRGRRHLQGHDRRRRLRRLRRQRRAEDLRRRSRTMLVELPAARNSRATR